MKNYQKKEDRQELFQQEERTVLDEDERPQRRTFLLTVNMFRNGLTGSGKSVAVSTEQGGEKKNIPEMRTGFDGHENTHGSECASLERIKR